MAKLIVAVGVFRAVPPSVVCTENTLFLVWTSPLVFIISNLRHVDNVQRKVRVYCIIRLIIF